MFSSKISKRKNFPGRCSVDVKEISTDTRCQYE